MSDIDNLGATNACALGQRLMHVAMQMQPGLVFDHVLK